MALDRGDPWEKTNRWDQSCNCSGLLSRHNFKNTHTEINLKEKKSQQPHRGEQCQWQLGKTESAAGSCGDRVLEKRKLYRKRAPKIYIKGPFSSLLSIQICKYRWNSVRAGKEEPSICMLKIHRAHTGQASTRKICWTPTSQNREFLIIF